MLITKVLVLVLLLELALLYTHELHHELQTADEFCVICLSASSLSHAVPPSLPGITTSGFIENHYNTDCSYFPLPERFTLQPRAPPV